MRRLLAMAIGLGTIACGSDKPTGPTMDSVSGDWSGTTTVFDQPAGAYLSVWQHAGRFDGQFAAGPFAPAIIHSGSYAEHVLTLEFPTDAQHVNIGRVACTLSDATHCAGTMTLVSYNGATGAPIESRTPLTLTRAAR